MVKTRGSDAKLVGQLQPYGQARACPACGRRVPPLVTRLADGEHGGVMMHEAPPGTWRSSAPAPALRPRC